MKKIYKPIISFLILLFISLPCLSQGDRYLAAATAYDRFQLNPENIAEGQWTVVIFMNDKFIGKKLFQISPSSPQL